MPSHAPKTLRWEIRVGGQQNLTNVRASHAYARLKLGMEFKRTAYEELYFDN